MEICPECLKQAGQKDDVGTANSKRKQISLKVVPLEKIAGEIIRAL